MPGSTPSSPYHSSFNNRWTSANTGRVPKPRGNNPQNRRANTMHSFANFGGRGVPLADFSLNENNNTIEPNLGPYASINFDDYESDAIDISGTAYQNTVTNLVNMSVANLKYSVDPIVKPLHVMSRKKLRETIVNGNNSLFNFLKRTDRTPVLSSTNPLGQGYGEYLLKKYSSELFMIRQANASGVGGTPDGNYYNCKDANIDSNVTTTVNLLDEKLKAYGSSTMTQLVEQVKWIGNELRSTSEDIMRLENQIVQKMETIDRIQGRVHIMNTLKPNEHLPELLDAFNQYVGKCYETAAIEEDFKELMECYKKWMILKDVVSFQKCVDTGNTNGPQKLNNDPGCSICLTEAVSNAIVPCGHTYCGTCIKKQSLTCYICRGPVRDRIKIFFT
jgi:hypothetical protein